MRLRRGAAQPPRRGSCPGQVGACSTHVTQHPQEIRRVLVRSTPSSQGAPRSQVWHRLATGRPPGLGGGVRVGGLGERGSNFYASWKKNPTDTVWWVHVILGILQRWRLGEAGGVEIESPRQYTREPNALVKVSASKPAELFSTAYVTDAWFQPGWSKGKKLPATERRYTK